MEWFYTPKILGAWETVAKFPNALESDLWEKNQDLLDFFAYPCRKQINIINTLARDKSSNLYAEINGFEYRWGIVPEILTSSREDFIAANSKQGATPPKLERPYGKHTQSRIDEITDEQQAMIDSKLTPIF